MNLEYPRPGFPADPRPPSTAPSRFTKAERARQQITSPSSVSGISPIPKASPDPFPGSVAHPSDGDNVEPRGVDGSPNSQGNMFDLGAEPYVGPDDSGPNPREHARRPRQQRHNAVEGMFEVAAGPCEGAEGQKKRRYGRHYLKRIAALVLNLHMPRDYATSWPYWIQRPRRTIWISPG